MCRADAGAGEHRDGGFGDKRQVDDDPVAFDDAVAFENVREPADLAVQIGVRQDALFAHLARPSRLAFPNDRGLVAARPGEMPVEAVVTDVRLPADEPFRKRLVPLHQFLPRFEPVQFLRHLRPERPGRVDGFPVEFLIGGERFDVGLFAESGGGFELAAGFLQRSDVGRHGGFSCAVGLTRSVRRIVASAPRTGQLAKKTGAARWGRPCLENGRVSTRSWILLP